MGTDLFLLINTHFFHRILVWLSISSEAYSKIKSQCELNRIKLGRSKYQVIVLIIL